VLYGPADGRAREVAVTGPGPASTDAPRPTARFPRWFLRAPELLFRLHLDVLWPTLVMLTTTGRRSGQRRSVVLDVARAERDRIWVVAGDGMRARWVMNLLADPRVEVRHRGRRWLGRATIGPADGPDAADLNVAIYRDRPRYVGLIYRLIGERVRDEADVRRLAAGTLAVRIDREISPAAVRP
jgi:deazaflavin-dependent oxidoreductase (nitroreductase family)